MAGADGLKSSILNKPPVEAESGVGPAEALETYSGSVGASKAKLSAPVSLVFLSEVAWETTL